MSTSLGWEGKGRYGSFRCGRTRGVQEKLWDPLRTRTIPERLRGAFTTRRYTNPRLPLPQQYRIPIFLSLWLLTELQVIDVHETCAKWVNITIITVLCGQWSRFLTLRLRDWTNISTSYAGAAADCRRRHSYANLVTHRSTRGQHMAQSVCVTLVCLLHWTSRLPVV